MKEHIPNEPPLGPMMTRLLEESFNGGAGQYRGAPELEINDGQTPHSHVEVASDSDAEMYRAASKKLGDYAVEEVDLEKYNKSTGKNYQARNGEVAVRVSITPDAHRDGVYDTGPLYDEINKIKSEQEKSQDN